MAQRPSSLPVAAEAELPLWTTRGDAEVKLRMEDSGLGAEPPQTVHQAFVSTVERFGEQAALSWRDGEQRRSLSYREYYQACRTAAKSFLKVPEPPTPSAVPAEDAVLHLLCLSAARVAALPRRRNPGLQLGRVVHRRHRHHFGGRLRRGHLHHQLSRGLSV
ncbi:unnamed protein product, partial [Tetraodon nigroviridis]